MYFRVFPLLTQLPPSWVSISLAWVYHSLAFLLLYPSGSSYSCTHTPDSTLSLREVSNLTQLPPSQVFLPLAWVHHPQAVLFLYLLRSPYPYTYAHNSSWSLMEINSFYCSLPPPWAYNPSCCLPLCLLSPYRVCLYLPLIRSFLISYFSPGSLLAI